MVTKLCVFVVIMISYSLLDMNYYFGDVNGLIV